MAETATAERPRPRIFGGYGLESVLAGALLVVGAIVCLALAVEPYAYTIYLSLHVLAAVVWVGGNVTLVSLGIVFERRNDQDVMHVLGRLGGWVGPRVYSPASFAVLAFGTAMM